MEVICPRYKGMPATGQPPRSAVCRTKIVYSNLIETEVSPVPTETWQSLKEGADTTGR